MANILILISGHLCMAPRPQKEAEALANTGHDVTVRGFWFDPELVKRDCLLMTNKKWRFEPIIDFQPIYRQKNFGIRLQSRVAKEKFKRFGTFSPALLGYGVKAMLKVARQFRADLTIVHSEPGLWVGNCLLDEGYRVGVDFEDWFSEDLLPDARAVRPIAQLKTLESRLARDCTYCLTTSHTLAEALAEAYQAPKPTVIYNTFPWFERQQIDYQKRDRHNPNLLSIHWFSQTIGPGRGLDTLFHALQYLKIRVEIHLRGKYPDSYHQELESLIPDEWRDYLFIHPTVCNAELLSRITEHDIGLALECTDIPSRDFTVTNKLFQYLQAGLAVIATDTVGQREIFSQQPAIGRLVPSNNPLSLAQALNELLEFPEKLKSAKDAALLASKKQFCWEIEAQKLVKLSEIAIINNSK
ncbi:glycosyltransferase [Scytonema sp. UIC 10036]|uniref:glycosyltransferase n=1 Tax=Scytonema sp. UIC 10036 TaxID=2304196 RepID=UPI0012DA92EE|nr:glycosyltransferase [Scytonema sp. UIC 10036]MUG94047.1 glycosyltransferase [Scytonema sp. UIC 10036]